MLATEKVRKLVSLIWEGRCPACARCVCSWVVQEVQGSQSVLILLVE